MGIQINGSTDRITAIDGTIDFVSNIGNIGLITASNYVLQDAITIGAGSTIIKTVNGKLGIGTDNPGFLLDVCKSSNDATIRTRSTTAGAWYWADSANTGYYGIRLASSGTEKWFVGSYASHNFQIKDGSSSGGAERFTIVDGTGNVGINETTPEEILDLGENNQQNLKVGQRGYLGQAYSTSATILGHSVKAKTTGTTAGGMIVTETNSGGGAPSAIRQESGTIQFHTLGSGTADAAFDSERLRIDANGNLIVNKDNARNHAVIILDKAEAGYAKLEFDKAASQKAYVELDASEDLVLYGAADVNQIFYAGGSERARIASDGMFHISDRNSSSAGQHILQGGSFGIRMEDTGGYNRWNIERNYGGWQSVPLVHLSAQGRVGINQASPGSALNVKAIGSASDGLQVTSSSHSSYVWQIQNNDNLFNGSLAGELGIRGSSGISFSANAGTSTHLRITSGGQLFVGGNTGYNESSSLISFATDAAAGGNMLSNSSAIYNHNNPAFLHIQNRYNTGTGQEAGIILHSKSSYNGSWAIYNKRTSTNYLSDLIFRVRTGQNASAERLRIESDGRVSTPVSNARGGIGLVGAFRARVTSSYDFSAGTRKINMGTEEFDANGWYDTSNSRYKPLCKGWYQLHFHLQFKTGINNNAIEMQLYPYFNGASTYGPVQGWDNNHGNYAYNSWSTIMLFDGVNDYVEMYGNCSHTTDVAVATHMMGYLVHPLS